MQIKIFGCGPRRTRESGTFISQLFYITDQVQLPALTQSRPSKLSLCHSSRHHSTITIEQSRTVDLLFTKALYSSAFTMPDITSTGAPQVSQDSGGD